MFPKNSGERKFGPMDRSLKFEISFWNNNCGLILRNLECFEIKMRSENESRIFGS